MIWPVAQMPVKRLSKVNVHFGKQSVCASQMSQHACLHKLAAPEVGVRLEQIPGAELSPVYLEPFLRRAELTSHGLGSDWFPMGTGSM